MNRKAIDLSMNVIIMLILFIALAVIMIGLAFYFSTHGKDSISNMTAIANVLGG